MSKNRLEAFSDGVIAILITITAVESRTPRGTTGAALTIRDGPASRAGPMSHPARRARSIRLTQLADTVAGCEDCRATS